MIATAGGAGRLGKCYYSYSTLWKVWWLPLFCRSGPVHDWRDKDFILESEKIDYTHTRALFLNESGSAFLEAPPVLQRTAGGFASTDTSFLAQVRFLFDSFLLDPWNQLLVGKVLLLPAGSGSVRSRVMRWSPKKQKMLTKIWPKNLSL